ncbi:SGNH/GDSL hydrolase family protein [Embleya sp. NPDC050154]|uniref:SGNH/GDSL hydrolase family protein n=1 Tax=Embleya sp. NPDC050154 TaxID=3363988 RepID=UPI003793C71E
MTGARHEVPVMIAGDSIGHVGSGDRTWRYRLWRHLRAHDVRLDLVGSKDPLGDIGAEVAEYRPDYLLVLMSVDDLRRPPIEPAAFEAKLRDFITEARRAGPSLRIVLGHVLPTHQAGPDPEFAARAASFNARIDAIAADLNTDESPVVVARTDAEFVAADHTGDGLHPNSAGEYRIAAAFADVLADRFHLGVHYPRPFPRVLDASTDAPPPDD